MGIIKESIIETKEFLKMPNEMEHFCYANKFIWEYNKIMIFPLIMLFTLLTKYKNNFA